jgi:hypothetical protein
MESNHGDTERKEEKVTKVSIRGLLNLNDTNQRIAEIIRNIRQFLSSPRTRRPEIVKFVINLFFSGFPAFRLSSFPCLCASVVFFFLLIGTSP